ncbi:UTRA domain-containing protein [Plantactinospora sp. WMMB334]|uniref:UTRA domain-containing protein n=1 Tax=Plantactinospora sp. WMMB334 TaxID=3404119 RepID=UPI003B93BF49
MTVVDLGFARLMRELRQGQGLSFRRLAKIVHYSHTYLWDIETGIKQPTPHVAEALDRGLNANGRLAQLVAVESQVVYVANTSPPTALNSDSVSHSVDVQTAGSAQRMSGSQPPHSSASQWAQAASLLYEIFVRNRPPLMRLCAERYSRSLRRRTGASPFRMEATTQGRAPRAECYAISRQSAPSEIAGLLSLAPGEQVVCRENRYYADEEPVQLGQTYIPLEIAKLSALFEKSNLGPGGLFERLEELGYRVARIREQVTTRFPTRQEALALKAPPYVPVILVLHTATDDNGTPFEVTRFTMRSDLMTVQYEIPLGD